MKEDRRWKLLSFSVQRWISGKSSFQARVSAGASLQVWKSSGRVGSERQGCGPSREPCYEVLQCPLLCWQR